MLNKPFSVIAAMNKRGIIGNKGDIPWQDKHDLQNFKRLTEYCTIIMGRKTSESIPKLPNRFPIVLSGEQSFEFANQEIAKYPQNDIWVIGGGSIYEQTLQMPQCRKIVLTLIDDDSEGDVYFPHVDSRKFKLSKMYDLKSGNTVTELICNVEEQSYLQLMRDILKSDNLRLFGKSLRFDIEKSFPLLTTKSVFFRGVFEELKFFLRGETNTKILDEKGVKIWNANTTREFLDRRNLTDYEVGEAGPIYGAQWNNFGGVNQLEYVLKELTQNPQSRRAIISAWNPPELEKMCLPPCHVSYQFLIDDGKLNCVMYQRSADVFLGLPFNIASTALLTTYLAGLLCVNRGAINIMLGDAHIYKEHVGACEKQLQNQPFLFPELNITKDFKNWDDVRNLEYSDLRVTNYNHHKKIKAQLIVN